eukprot:TRINITY_DN49845_c0_g1_i1.p1 TRINITY_DN49845_c0_g1~~TRINITY_DN49845_c0_g1_i1.p1  ORF type:complete len:211 (+),score=25.33 TRINITY_DN49845_c0_g1_i1:496-1128(+)
MATLDIAKGITNGCHRGLVSAQCLAWASRRARYRRKVEFAHVKGHSGQPFNEFADDTANAARQGTWTCMLRRYLGDGESSVHQHWDFLQHADEDICNQYPKYYEEGLKGAIPMMALEHKELLTSFARETKEVEPDVIEVTFMTANDSQRQHAQRPRKQKSRSRPSAVSQEAYLAGTSKTIWGTHCWSARGKRQARRLLHHRGLSRSDCSC